MVETLILIAFIVFACVSFGFILKKTLPSG